MLSKDNRLRHNNEILTIMRKGKRHYFGGVLLYYRENPLKYSRIGFIVSKKYSPLAVRRNWQKRILRHILRDLLPEIISGKDIVISYTNHGKVLPYKKAQETILTLLKTNNLLVK